MKLKYLAITFLAVSNASIANASSRLLFTQFESESFSEIAPIEQIIHDLEGDPVNPGHFAFTHNQIEVGQQQGNIELSYFLRYDYFVEFSRDTAELAYLLRNDLPLPDNKTYDVDLRANHIFAQGIAAAYRFEFQEMLSGKIKLNYLNVSKTKDGSLRGLLTSQEDSYNANLHLDYGYTEDTLLDRPKNAKTGHGVSLDLDLFWQASDKLTLGLQARDMLSWIRFSKLTYTTADADTNNVSFDEDGRISTKPAVIGVEGFRNQTQKLPHRYSASAKYFINQSDYLRAETFSYNRNVFPRLAYGRQFSEITTQLEYDFRSKALGLAFTGKYLSLKLRSDDLDWEKATHLELAISFKIQL